MENALVHVLTALGVAGFAALAMRAARQPPLVDERTQAVILRHGKPIKALAVVSLLLPIPGFALLIIGPVNNVATWACVGYVVGFGLLAVYAILDAFLTRVAVASEGIVTSTAWRGINSLAWDEVREITFSGANKWFVIRGMKGRTIRISLFLVGITEFEKAVRSRLSLERYQKAKSGFELITRGCWQ